MGERVRLALQSLAAKHRDDDVHPLDLKEQKAREQKRLCADATHKAMIWAAASGHFFAEILSSKHFEKKVALALMSRDKNVDFDIAALFSQFANFSVKLEWTDCAKRKEGAKRCEVLTFRDILSIRSYRKELNHCDALWKFIFYDERHLFWSMAIYYALLKTTTVNEWDAMFEHEFALIEKYGKDEYIHADVEAMEKAAHAGTEAK